MSTRIVRIGWLILLTATGFSINAQIDPVLAEQLQTVLNLQVSITGHHGVSACVIMPDGQIWKGQAGVNEIDEPITEETVFVGASTTKSNMATLFLLLQEEGILNLDDTWSQYVSLPIAINPGITIRQLLSHTSGIADYLESVEPEELWLDPTHTYTPEEILENFVSEESLFLPGNDFFYSNSNYVIAGMIVEAVTGNTVSEELHARIWDPLGMSHTHFGGFESYTEDFAGIWWSFGNGLQSYNDISHNAMFSYAYGAGNILTTPSDEALFINALLSGELLSEASMQEMTTFSPQSFSTWTGGYGLGIHHAIGNTGEEILGHDGYYLNLTSMFKNLTQGFTIVTMTNTKIGWFGIFDPLYETLSDYLQVNETSAENQISLFPNPSDGSITLVCPQILSSIQIHDARGKLVFTENNYESGTTLNTSLSAGFYVVTVKNTSQISKHTISIR